VVFGQPDGSPGTRSNGGMLQRNILLLNCCASAHIVVFVSRAEVRMIHGDWLSKWAQVEPGKPALIDIDSGRTVSYRQLNERADRAANLLSREFGVGRGDRVAVLGANRLEQLDVYFAVAKLGAVLVPVNWRLAADEVAFVLGDADPTVLLFGEDVRPTVDRVQQQGWAGPSMAFDGADGGYASLLEASASSPVATEDVGPDTPVMLLYTSGTTGRPKGAVLTHGTITFNAINTATGWDLRGDDVTITHTPLFHTGGWNVLTLPLLHRGATVVLAERFDPDQTLDAIGRYGITVLFAVPTMFQMMLDSEGFERADLSPVRFFISGGAACPVPLIEAWQNRGVVFKQGYGLTEVGPNCFVLHERDAVRKAGSVGFPTIHLDARIVDGQGREVGPDEVGELQLRGPTVCAGYWRNPASTADAVRDGWFATGDLFRRDREGYHYVVGRLKELFISGGENIYPAEVERVLYEVPAVVEAAVVPRPDVRWGEVGHAFVALGETNGAGQPSPESILEHCRSQLARYKVPKSLTVLPELPKGSSGKIHKRELQDLAEKAR